MDLSELKQNIRVGVEQIDQQHLQLLRYLEKIEAALLIPDEEARRRECADVIAFTQHYAAIHFSTEEHYQKTIDFPEREHHRTLHEQFVRDTGALAEKLEASRYRREDVQAFADYLHNWFVHHIVEEDTRMAPFSEGPAWK